METQTYLNKLVFVLIIYIVLVTECMYRNGSRVRLEPNLYSIAGTSDARNVLSCVQYCKKPVQLSLAFFFKVPRKDCLDYFQKGYKRDGRYELEPTSGIRTNVCSDMKNGGWTVIQSRLDGSVDFYRNWTEYARRFGDKDREYWIGLDNIHYLTQENAELYIYMETFGAKTPIDGYAWYSRFSVANAALLYRLTLDGIGYKGNVKDSLADQTGMKFTTFDRDNDLAGTNSAIKYHGAWWYRHCHRANLNGQYLAGGHCSHANGVNWFHPWRFNYSLKTVIMKVRRV